MFQGRKNLLESTATGTRPPSSLEQKQQPREHQHEPQQEKEEGVLRLDARLSTAEGDKKTPVFNSKNAFNEGRSAEGGQDGPKRQLPTTITEDETISQGASLDSENADASQMDVSATVSPADLCEVVPGNGIPQPTSRKRSPFGTGGGLKGGTRGYASGDQQQQPVEPGSPGNGDGIQTATVPQSLGGYEVGEAIIAVAQHGHVTGPGVVMETTTRTTSMTTTTTTQTTTETTTQTQTSPFTTRAASTGKQDTIQQSRAGLGSFYGGSAYSEVPHGAVYQTLTQQRQHPQQYLASSGAGVPPDLSSNLGPPLSRYSEELSRHYPAPLSGGSAYHVSLNPSFEEPIADWSTKQQHYTAPSHPGAGSGTFSSATPTLGRSSTPGVTSQAAGLSAETGQLPSGPGFYRESSSEDQGSGHGVGIGVESASANPSSDPNLLHVCSELGCGKQFASAFSLKRHRAAIHDRDRPFVCQYPGCGKSYVSGSNLNTHMRVHTNVRPFVCPFDGCGKRFAAASTLASHKLTHTGERPFVCNEPGCGKSFTRSSHMNTHQRSAHGDKRNDSGRNVHAGADVRDTMNEQFKIFSKQQELSRGLSRHDSDRDSGPPPPGMTLGTAAIAIARSPSDAGAGYHGMARGHSSSSASAPYGSNVATAQGGLMHGAYLSDSSSRGSNRGSRIDSSNSQGGQWGVPTRAQDPQPYGHSEMPDLRRHGSAGPMGEPARMGSSSAGEEGGEFRSAGMDFSPSSAPSSYPLRPGSPVVARGGSFTESGAFPASSSSSSTRYATGYSNPGQDPESQLHQHHHQHQQQRRSYPTTVPRDPVLHAPATHPQQQHYSPREPPTPFGTSSGASAARDPGNAQYMYPQPSQGAGHRSSSAFYHTPTSHYPPPPASEGLSRHRSSDGRPVRYHPPAEDTSETGSGRFVAYGEQPGPAHPATYASNSPASFPGESIHSGGHARTSISQRSGYEEYPPSQYGGQLSETALSGPHRRVSHHHPHPHSQSQHHHHQRHSHPHYQQQPYRSSRAHERESHSIATAALDGSGSEVPEGYNDRGRYGRASIQRDVPPAPEYSREPQQYRTSTVYDDPAPYDGLGVGQMRRSGSGAETGAGEARMEPNRQASDDVTMGEAVFHPAPPHLATSQQPPSRD